MDILISDGQKVQRSKVDCVKRTDGNGKRIKRTGKRNRRQLQQTDSTDQLTRKFTMGFRKIPAVESIPNLVLQ